MRLHVNFDLKSVSIGRSWLQKFFSKECWEFLEDLLSCVCWPESESTEFWVEDMSDVVSRLYEEVPSQGRAPVEYLFDSAAFYCNAPRVFYLCNVMLFRSIVEDEATSGFYGDRESIFGNPRKLTQEQDVYAVWIFYRLLDPYGRYTKAELKSLIGKWLDVIRRDPAEWEAWSGVPRSDVRFFSEYKKYRWHLNL